MLRISVREKINMDLRRDEHTRDIIEVIKKLLRVNAQNMPLVLFEIFI